MMVKISWYTGPGNWEIALLIAPSGRVPQGRRVEEAETLRRKGL
jgi:hypothetical protein